MIVGTASSDAGRRRSGAAGAAHTGDPGCVWDRVRVLRVFVVVVLDDGKADENRRALECPGNASGHLIVNSAGKYRRMTVLERLATCSRYARSSALSWASATSCSMSSSWKVVSGKHLAWVPGRRWQVPRGVDSGSLELSLRLLGSASVGRGRSRCRGRPSGLAPAGSPDLSLSRYQSFVAAVRRSPSTQAWASVRCAAAHVRPAAARARPGSCGPLAGLSSQTMLPLASKTGGGPAALGVLVYMAADYLVKVAAGGVLEPANRANRSSSSSISGRPLFSGSGPPGSGGSPRRSRGRAWRRCSSVPSTISPAGAVDDGADDCSQAHGFSSGMGRVTARYALTARRSSALSERLGAGTSDQLVLLLLLITADTITLPGA